MDKPGLLEWLRQNYDGFGAALLFTFAAASLSALLQRATLTGIGLSLLSGFLLTGTVVPFSAVYWSLPWFWWGPMGLVLGVAGIAIMWMFIRMGRRAEQRSGDILDGIIRRVLPSTPDPVPPKDGGTP